MAPPPWSTAFVDAPWCRDLLPAAATLRDLPDWPSLAELNRRLDAYVNPPGLPRVAFAPSAPRSRRAKRRDLSALYDVRIHREGLVATRLRNPHDLFNALVWASFPLAKRALARRQHDAHVRRLGVDLVRLPNARSREQDTLAMIDEGGVLCAPGRRVLFGHALYEHLWMGDAGVRGYPVELADGATDDALARALADDERFSDPGNVTAVSLDREQAVAP